MSKKVNYLPWELVKYPILEKQFSNTAESGMLKTIGMPEMPLLEECGGCSEGLLQEQVDIALNLLDMKLASALDELTAEEMLEDEKTLGTPRG